MLKPFVFAPGPEKPGPMLKSLALAVADGVLPLPDLNSSCQSLSIWAAKAPASRMKRLAMSAVQELPKHLVSAGLESAGKQSRLEHAERDLIRLFASLGMSCPLVLSTYQFGQHSVPHVKLHSWFSVLLKERSDLLFGGFRKDQQEAQLALQTFWLHYKATAPDHTVYRSHSDRLSNCLPYYLFFDEGVGLRKSGVLVVSWEILLGLDTAKVFQENLSKAGRRPDLTDVMTVSQCHNAKGRTWDTRFLYTVLPKKVYKAKGQGILEKLLHKLALECVQMMQEGVSLGGRTFYPICLGVKGDAPMQAKLGAFTRNFQRMGRNKGCCFECKAGLDPYCFEDVRLAPAWEETIFAQRPYTNPSPLLQIPACPSAPEGFFKRDPFHVFKQSIGCTFLSSSIVLLCEFGYFPGESESVLEQLNRAYDDFALWVKVEWPGKSMQSLKAFTKDLFHWPRIAAFPAGRFKGSDAMLMMRWIEHAMLHGFVDMQAENPQRSGRSPLHVPLEPWHAEFMEQILKASSAGVRFFHLIHRGGLWLPRDVELEVGYCSAQFTQAFSRLAKLCSTRSMPRYHLVPSLHSFHHFWIDSKRATRDPSVKFCLSPNTSNCEANEDFVGKVARLTRKVHARSTAARTIQRYRIKLWCEWQGIR